MRLVSLRASGWRNLQRVALRPGQQINLICGRNAQGKTNLLEAIYFVASLRSFRTTRTAELVRWDEQHASIRATVHHGGINTDLAVGLGGRGKLLEVDGSPVSRDRDYFTGFTAVLFTPEHLSLVRGDASARRQFLDRLLFGLDPSHLETVRRYNTVLRQRNAALKEYAHRPESADPLLRALDVQLSRLGADLAVRRQEVTARLAPRARELYREVAGPADRDAELSLAYRALPFDGAWNEYAEWLLDRLHQSHAADLARGYTRVGPHRDELRISLRGRPAAKSASQGEARSVVLCLKLAELLLLQEAHDEPPVLLLDDLGSELDAHRREVLFRVIGRLGAQTFVTSVEANLLQGPEPERVFRVRDGVVSEADGIADVV